MESHCDREGGSYAKKKKNVCASFWLEWKIREKKMREASFNAIFHTCKWTLFTMRIQSGTQIVKCTANGCPVKRNWNERIFFVHRTNGRHIAAKKRKKNEITNNDAKMQIETVLRFPLSTKNALIALWFVSKYYAIFLLLCNIVKTVLYFFALHLSLSLSMYISLLYAW